MLKQILLITMLILFPCGTVMAEWVRAGGTHKYDGYTDLSTIGANAQRVTMWTMKDFKVTKQIPLGAFRSVKIKKQYDCRGNKSRLLLLKYFTEPMGKGRVLFSGKGTQQWSRVTPESDNETEWKIACKRK